MRSSIWSASVVGPTLGGAAIGLFGPVVTIAADAVSYLLSALGITAIGGAQPGPPAREAPRPRLAGLAEGWRYMLRHRQLRRSCSRAVRAPSASRAPLSANRRR